MADPEKWDIGWHVILLLDIDTHSLDVRALEDIAEKVKVNYAAECHPFDYDVRFLDCLALVDFTQVTDPSGLLKDYLERASQALGRELGPDQLLKFEVTRTKQLKEWM